jgi:AraC-like DNA-binding protein
MEIVGAIGAINAVIIAFFLSKKQDKSISDRILTIWVLLFALHFSIPFFIEKRLFFHELFWGYTLGVVIVTHMPLLFIYTNSLVNRNFKLSLGNLWHFGFVLLYIMSLIPAFILGKEDFLELVEGKQDSTYHLFLPMMTSLFFRIYFLMRTIIVLLRHQYIIKEEFSYERNIDLAWIKRIVYAFAIIIVLSFVAYALVSINFISVYQMDYINIVANLLLFFYIAYSGYSQQAIFQAGDEIHFMSEEKTEMHQSKEEVLSPAAVNQIPDPESDPKISELVEIMNREKPYLEQELTIGELALQLNMHSHQLSKMLNDSIGKNFFEFINDYRLEEFKKLAVNPKNKHISILGLAMEAGFNSKATFNRFFKNATGLTPSEFMESYKF